MKADPDPKRQLEHWRGLALDIEAAVKAVVIGQDEAVRLICIAILTRGQVILEDNVGVECLALLRPCL